MARKVKTVKIGGNVDYAKVADRLKLFWEENPNGKIDTEREDLPDGKIRFVARIWRNKDELLELAKAGADAEVIKLSASATGSADAVRKGDKENEKLETVATGRALAMLGYAASGEVASREEMEQFEEFKEQQRLEEIEQFTKAIGATKTMEALRDLFVSIRPEIRGSKEIIAAKDKQKEALSKPKPKKEAKK